MVWLVSLFFAPPRDKLPLPFQRFLNVTVKEVEKRPLPVTFYCVCVHMWVCGISAHTHTHIRSRLHFPKCKYKASGCLRFSIIAAHRVFCAPRHGLCSHSAQKKKRKKKGSVLSESRAKRWIIFPRSHAGCRQKLQFSSNCSLPLSQHGCNVLFSPFSRCHKPEV